MRSENTTERRLDKVRLLNSRVGTLARFRTFVSISNQQVNSTSGSDIQMLQKLGYSVGLVLVSAVVAQAGVIGVVQKMVNPGSAAAPYNGFANAAFAQDTDLNSGTLAQTWVSYVLGVQATAGEKISSFDIAITSPVTPTTGMLQRWNFNVDTETFTPSPSSTNTTNGDSHLIVQGSVVVVAPAETKLDAGGPPIPADTAARDYGVGGSLSGLWGFSQAEQNAQTGVVPFAYVVVPRGHEPQVVISVGAGANDASGQPIAGGFRLTNADFGFFFIPEPATVSLFGLAMIGVVGFARRRK
jgi:hypothetical protein